MTCRTTRVIDSSTAKRLTLERLISTETKSTPNGARHVVSTPRRDFTFVGDIVAGITASLAYCSRRPTVFNLGNNQPVEVLRFIRVIEQMLSKRAVRARALVSCRRRPPRRVSRVVACWRLSSVVVHPASAQMA